MSAGSQNQVNRLGHGVAGAHQVAAGAYTLVANTEYTLGEIINSVITASIVRFAPFEVRLLLEFPGVGVSTAELRTRPGVTGYPIPHLPQNSAAHPEGLQLFLAQNAEAPNDKIIIANPNAANNLTLYVLLLG